MEEKMDDSLERVVEREQERGQDLAPTHGIDSRFILDS